MKNATTLFLVPFLAVAVSACSGSSGGDGGSVACTGTNLTATAANNYSFSSTLTCPPIAVAPKTETRRNLSFNGNICFISSTQAL